MASVTQILSKENINTYNSLQSQGRAGPLFKVSRFYKGGITLISVTVLYNYTIIYDILFAALFQHLLVVFLLVVPKEFFVLVHEFIFISSNFIYIAHLVKILVFFLIVFFILFL